jgi:hypothetical protein
MDVVAINNETVDVPADGELDRACHIRAMLNSDTDGTESGAHHIQQSCIAG